MNINNPHKGDLRLSFLTEKITLPPNLVVEGDLDLSCYKFDIELPECLRILGSLDLYDSNITTLPEDLYVEGDLDIGETFITRFPSKLYVGGEIFCNWYKIENYPLVKYCGNIGRTIHLDCTERDKIHIGCFEGTQEEALLAVYEKYCHDKEACNKYCDQIIKCFILGEQIWGSK